MSSISASSSGVKSQPSVTYPGRSYRASHAQRSMFEALTAVSAMMVAQTMSLIMGRLSTAQPANRDIEGPAVNYLDSALRSFGQYRPASSPAWSLMKHV